MNAVLPKIKVTVLFFAVLKDATGLKRLEIELERPQTCGQILRGLSDQFVNLSGLLQHCRLAVNGAFVDPSRVLAGGDELALLPPVSGG